MPRRSRIGSIAVVLMIVTAMSFVLASPSPSREIQAALTRCNSLRLPSATFHNYNGYGGSSWDEGEPEGHGVGVGITYSKRQIVAAFVEHRLSSGYQQDYYCFRANGTLAYYHGIFRSWGNPKLTSFLERCVDDRQTILKQKKKTYIENESGFQKKYLGDTKYIYLHRKELIEKLGIADRLMVFGLKPF